MVLDIFTKIWRSSKYMSVKAANDESVFDFPIDMTKKTNRNNALVRPADEGAV
jgi:hypothetical protein